MKKQRVEKPYARESFMPELVKASYDRWKISTREMQIITPEENPNAPAKTRLDASLTSLGKNTTAAPSIVQAPEAKVRPIDAPTFPSAKVMMAIENRYEGEK